MGRASLQLQDTSLEPDQSAEIEWGKPEGKSEDWGGLRIKVKGESEKVGLKLNI